MVLNKIFTNPIRLLLCLYNFSLRDVAKILNEKEGFVYKSIRNYDFYNKPYSYIEKIATFLNISQDLLVKKDLKNSIKVEAINKIIYLNFNDYFNIRFKGLIVENYDSNDKRIYRKIENVDLLKLLLDQNKNELKSFLKKQKDVDQINLCLVKVKNVSYKRKTFDEILKYFSNKNE